jgi:hypothetical protein
MKRITGITLFFMITMSTLANADTLLYQNNFDTAASPTYSTVFGDPQIVGPVLSDTTNSLAFNTAGNVDVYDQIQYGIDALGSPYQGTSYSKFDVSFDIATTGLIGSTDYFAVLFDTPTVRNLYFNPDGTISTYNIGSGSSGVIGSYTDSQFMHVDMTFDIAANQWDISLDNTLLYSDAMDASYLRSIRFSHGIISGIDPSATTYIDNVRISAVPVPAAIWLFASGLLGLTGMAKRRQI